MAAIVGSWRDLAGGLDGPTLTGVVVAGLATLGVVTRAPGVGQRSFVPSRSGSEARVLADPLGMSFTSTARTTSREVARNRGLHVVSVSSASRLGDRTAMSEGATTHWRATL